MGKRRDWKKISEAVEKIKELGFSYKDGARQFNIKVRDIYDYNRRFNKEGNRSDKRGDGKSSSKSDARSSLPDDVQQLIVDYRREHPDHGFKRIEETLKSKYLVVVRRKQIRQVLKENDLLETLDSSFDREPATKKGSKRFEASFPRQLYQMDVTYVYIRGIRVLYLVVIIDDYSRFVVAADLCHDQRADTLIGVLHNAIAHHGKPQKLLTDQGSGFYSWSSNQTVFEHYLDEHHIEHIVSEPHSPQSQGKVERVIQTIKKELLGRVNFSGYADARGGIVDYVRSYNFERAHQGINGARPADRFYGVIGETSRIESELVGNDLDFSKGYLVFKVEDHQLSVVCSCQGFQIFWDGKLLKEDHGHDTYH
jgi:transposase InsO family protein